MLAPFDSKASATAVTDLGSSGARRVEQGFPARRREVLRDRRSSSCAGRRQHREISHVGNPDHLIPTTGIVSALMHLVLAHVAVGPIRRYALYSNRRINAGGAHRPGECQRHETKDDEGEVPHPPRHTRSLTKGKLMSVLPWTHQKRPAAERKRLPFNRARIIAPAAAPRSAGHPTASPVSYTRRGKPAR